MELLWEMGHPEQILWGTIRESDRYTESEGQRQEVTGTELGREGPVGILGVRIGRDEGLSTGETGNEKR